MMTLFAPPYDRANAGTAANRQDPMTLCLASNRGATGTMTGSKVQEAGGVVFGRLETVEMLRYLPCWEIQGLQEFIALYVPFKS